jgi:hypothetical protein
MNIIDMVYQLYRRGRPPYMKKKNLMPEFCIKEEGGVSNPSQRCEQSLHIAHIIRRHWSQAIYSPRDNAT